MLKKLLTLLAFAYFIQVNAQPYAASNFTLCSKIDPQPGTGSKYSGCWGWYQASKNREYAIAGSASGTYFVDVTNPYQQVVCDFEPGKITTTVWREIKTYQNYCYVVSDDSGPNSFQIFDMQYLPDSVHKVHDSQDLFKRGHAIWVDQSRLYVSSVTYSDNTKSTLNVYSLATPTLPVLVRKLSQDAPFITSVHDTYANNDTVFVSAAYQGLYVFTFNPASPAFTQVGSLTSYVSSGYNHASAITPNRKTLVFMDEVPASLPIKIADVQNLGNIQVLATINQGSLTTPHNPFMANDSLCFVSSYQDGLQLFNIKNPSAPFLAGYFDTYPQGGFNTGTYPGGAYNGQWGSYPYLPSKNIFALDMKNGMFMLKTHLFSNPTSNGGENSGPTGGESVGTNTGTILTGITENELTTSIAIYPNPSNGIVGFTIPVELINQPFEVAIVDVKGKTVMYATSSDIKGVSYHKTLNVSSIENGIYFFKLTANKTVLKNSKLIIAK